MKKKTKNLIALIGAMIVLAFAWFMFFIPESMMIQIFGEPSSEPSSLPVFIPYAIVALLVITVAVILARASNGKYIPKQ
jgi:uncharacterized protein with PQ loop repeat